MILDADEMTLQPVWEEALSKWLESQDTETPFGWNDFFITGPSMDVVASGTWHDTSPQPILYRFVNELVNNITQSPRMKEMLREGLTKAEIRITHHEHVNASVSSASMYPRLHQGEQSSPKIAEGSEAADEEPNPTPSKPPRLRLLRTSDHYFTARHSQATGNTAFEPVGYSQQDTLVDRICESPSYNPWQSPTSPRHVATLDEHQQRLALSRPEILLNPNDSSMHAKNLTSAATYHVQVTVGLDEIGTQPDENGSSSERQNFCSPGEPDAIAKPEVCPPMPGAYPHDEMECSSSTELDLDAEPHLSDSFKELAIPQNTQEEDHLIKDDSDSICVLPVDSDLVIPNPDDVLPVTHQLVSEAACTGNKQLPYIPDVGSISTNDVAPSTQTKDQSRTAELPATDGSICGNAAVLTLDDQSVPQHAAHVALSESEMSRDTGTKLLSSDQTGFAAWQGRVTQADKPSVATRSTLPQVDHDSNVIEDSDTTGTFEPASLLPMSGLSLIDKPLEGDVPSSEGLPVKPLAPHFEMESSFSRSCFIRNPWDYYMMEDNSRFKDSSWWETWSLPAMHFAPTSKVEVFITSNAGCHSVVEYDTKSENGTSDWETQSSLSDYDRPWGKQHDLIKELWQLFAEEVEYESTFSDEYGGNRLERLRHDLNSIEPATTERTQSSTWDNWPNEPSENDSADESWATNSDAHASETEDEEGEDTQERKASKAHEQELSRAQHNSGSPSATRPDVAAPALTARESLDGPIKYRRQVFDFQFNPAALNINTPKFNGTPFTSHAATLPPTMEALQRIFGDFIIGPASKAAEPIRKDVPSMNPVPQKDSGSDNISNEWEEVPYQDEDQKGIRYVPNKRQKRADSASPPARQPGESKSNSEPQQNNSRVNHGTHRKMRHAGHRERSALVARPNPQSRNQHRKQDTFRAPAYAWGADVELRPWRKPREPFREEDYLYQKWSF